MSLLPSSQSLIIEIYKLINESKRKPEVVVVGYGWGGSAFENNIDIKKYNVKIVSKSTARFNQPYIISNLEPSFTDPPARVELIEDEALSIDELSQKVKTKKTDYYYDYLVIATGSEVNDFGIKGVKENCLMFKTESDVNILKKAIDDHREITVIGAGPTGVELAFKLESLGKQVTILEAGKQILPGFSEQMRNETLRLLNKSNIVVKTETQIKEIYSDGYKTPTSSINDKTIKIWTCGIKPSLFARNFISPLKPDSQLMIKPRIYAIGDSIVGHGPPTAQNAARQGSYLAALFNSEFQDLTPYRYVERGRVIDATSCLIVEYNGILVTVPGLFRSIYTALTR